MRKTCTDTQLRQMLQAAHQRRAIAEALADCISLANEAYARRHGCDPIERIGRNLLELVPTEDRDAVRAQMAAALCTDEVLESCQPDHRGGLDAGDSEDGPGLIEQAEPRVQLAKTA
ncbi:PAS domain-containing protein [Burkholderiaceae bacterium UC74_6]